MEANQTKSTCTVSALAKLSSCASCVSLHSGRGVCLVAYASDGKIVIQKLSTQGSQYSHTDLSQSDLVQGRFPIEINYSGIITSLQFGNESYPLKLIITSRKKSVLYDISRSDLAPQILTTAELHGFCHGTRFEKNDCFVGLMMDCRVLVFNLPLKNKPTWFEGHLLKITDFVFFKHHTADLMITTSEDRTFIVWNLMTRTCVFHSSILSSSPIRTVAPDPTLARIVIGSEDGVLRFFDLTPYRLDKSKSCEPRLITSLPLELQKSPSKDSYATDSVPIVVTTRQRIPVSRSESPSNNEQLEEIPAVISIKYVGTNTLIVGCNSGLFIINSKTYQMLLNLPYLSESLISDSSLSFGINYATSYEFCDLDSKTFGTAVVEGISGQISILCIQQEPAENHSVDETKFDNVTSLEDLVCQSVRKNVGGWWATNISFDILDQLSRIRIRDLIDLRKCDISELKNIPPYLRTDFLRFCKTCNITTDLLNEYFRPSKIPAKKVPPTIVKASNLTKGDDKPVTFHKTVKSSGYSTAPKFTSMFQQSKKTIKSPTLKRQTPTYGSSSSISTPCPKSPEPHTAPVLTLRFSSSGNMLASGSADRTIRCYAAPYFSKSDGKILKVFSGQGSAVKSISWGYNEVVEQTNKSLGLGTLLLACTIEGAARIWGTNRSDALLEFGGLDSKNRSKGTEDAIFSSRNRLIITSSKTSLHFHSYTLEVIDSKLIKPQINNNTHRVIRTISATSNICAISSANTFYSRMLFAATSNKSLGLWDIETGTQVRCIENAHSRCINHIAIPDFAEARNLDMFATAAMGDSIKVYDIRTASAVNHLHGHQNRQIKIDCAISPCGRFIASGSEDNHAYMYDLRKGQVLHKLDGFSDMVTSIAFNPCYPELAAGCLDGKTKKFFAK